MVLTVALNYSGRSEIVEACREIVAEFIHSDRDPSAISEDDIAQHLFTKDLPDPDLLIRTSGELRVSNFLLWQIAYSEIYVTDVLWPDFRSCNRHGSRHVSGFGPAASQVIMVRREREI